MAKGEHGWGPERDIEKLGKRSADTGGVHDKKGQR
jgi:hypothetical protein